MNLHEYQTLNKEYADKFKRNHEQGNECFLALGLCEEAGEVASIIRKAYRRYDVADKEKLTEELGDVFCYLVYIGTKHNIDIQEIIDNNARKISKGHRLDKDTSV